ETRLAAIHDMARKHAVEPEMLTQRLQALTQELAELEGGEERIQALESERENLLADYRKSAKALNRKRQKGASELGKEVTGEIPGLGLPEGAFEIALLPRDDDNPHPTGAENIEF